MKRLRLPLAIVSAIFVCTSFVSAQTSVTTDPVGYVSIACPAGSDTIVSVPLTRPPEFTGAVASVSGSTITISGTTGWVANQFVYAKGTQSNHYYVLIGPNPVALAGTVSTTQGSNIISGVGTNFLTSVHVGDVLILNNSSYYTVTGVTSDTALTVSIAPKATATGVSANISAESTNPNEGSIYAITANDTTSLTVDLKGDTIDSVKAGTQVVVTPYWTLGSLFPASSAGVSFTETPAATFRTHQTEILIPEYSKVGISIAPSKNYFFVSGAWRLFGRPLSEDYSDDPLLPNTYFIVRNPATAVAGTLTIQGNVQSKMFTIPLSAEAGTFQDTLCGVARPTDVTLNELGLIESGVFTATDSVNFRVLADQLLVFDYVTPMLRKQPSKIYFYCRGGWRQFGKPLTVDCGSDVIAAGSGFIIRKQSANQKQLVFWQNVPNFN